jgi:two-component system chemotaxis response regulator CheB
MKILIVDDNVIYRNFLSEVVKSIDGAELISPAANGRIALSRLAGDPADLVLLDMQMPEMDGIETLKEIRRKYPEIGVIMISAAYDLEARLVIQALEMGAIDFISKTGDRHSENHVTTLRQKISTILNQIQGRRHLHNARRVTQKSPNRTGGRKPVKTPSTPRPEPARNGISSVLQDPGAAKTRRIRSAIDLVVIGASTGGPNALSEIISRFPEDFSVPVLIVQHMPAFLTATFARSLNAKSRLSVTEGVAGDMITPGRVYIAPGGKHMTVRNGRFTGSDRHVTIIDLNEDPPVNSVRPSADVLFSSVKKHFTGMVLAVIMTGMGNDGMKGVRELKERDCYCLSQTEETCVVYGMPRAVEEASLSDEQVPLDGMADRIMNLVANGIVRF